MSFIYLEQTEISSCLNLCGKQNTAQPKLQSPNREHMIGQMQQGEQSALTRDLSKIQLPWAQQPVGRGRKSSYDICYTRRGGILIVSNTIRNLVLWNSDFLSY